MRGAVRVRARVRVRVEGEGTGKGDTWGRIRIRVRVRVFFGLKFDAYAKEISLPTREDRSEHKCNEPLNERRDGVIRSDVPTSLRHFTQAKQRVGLDL